MTILVVSYSDLSFLCVLCSSSLIIFSFFFFFNDTATTEIYTLSLHDALPISSAFPPGFESAASPLPLFLFGTTPRERSEEHTSELQSQSNLVCRLLLEKKKKKTKKQHLTEENQNIINHTTIRTINNHETHISI